MSMFSHQKILTFMKVVKPGLIFSRFNNWTVCSTFNVAYFSSFPRIGCPQASFILQDVSKDISQLQTRFYAKSKDKKGKDGKHAKKIHISDDEMSQVIDVESMREDFKGATERLKDDYVKNFSIRTSLGTIEQLNVQFEGDIYPMNELAQIVRKSPTVVVIISTVFPQAAADILKALKASGMNLNPQQEGSSIFVPLPKVTKDYREGLSKNAKTVCDKNKMIIREIANKYVQKAKNKEDSVSEDTLFMTINKIREIASDFQAEAEKLLKNKQNELMQVNK